MQNLAFMSWYYVVHLKYNGYVMKPLDFGKKCTYFEKDCGNCFVFKDEMFGDQLAIIPIESILYIDVCYAEAEKE